MGRTIESYTGQREMKDSSDYTFEEIVDMYMQTSETFFQMLENFEPSNFFTNPSGTGEILYKRIERMALHYLGHTGQIVLIRKMLGRGIAGSYAFDKAMSKPTRMKIRKEWIDLWNANKESFN